MRSILCGLVVSTFALIAQAWACNDGPLPEGATKLGFTRLAFNICPNVSDISMDGRGDSAKLYNGVWWDKAVPPKSLYTDNADGSLSISFGGALATVPRTMTPGALPLLRGTDGFFVEFEVSLSDNDHDHFPAVWLMPIEHNQRLDDSYQPDERGFERWIEIDVDEGGFAPGPMGTAISWSGTWPNYTRVRSNPDLYNQRIDRSHRHKFAAGFDPKTLTITFWHDDKIQYVAKGESVPEIARKQNFYVIMNAASHKLNLPYTMNVYGVRAFIPN
ncbi:hypothetical protein [Bradyrhizobium sp. LTSP885]|uniref:hypothetical protein n=1 Tax=Bradyrhizobium sp. LTSP885 TaxID=1619232 RepID=UPI0012E0A4A5|nr:hypothetical protein [Bradyrhizobium sp. LTSP885]